jgi:hypothetical protein
MPEGVPNASRAEQPHAELWEKHQSMAIATKGSCAQSASTGLSDDSMRSEQP